MMQKYSVPIFGLSGTIEVVAESEAEARQIVKDGKYEKRQCYIDLYDIMDVGAEDEIENVTKAVRNA